MEKIQRILSEKEVMKASQLFGIDEASLQRLNDQFLLNAEYIRAALIKNDFQFLTRGLRYYIEADKAYTNQEILIALQKEYRIPTTALRNILFGKMNENMHFCSRCGVRITQQTYKRTNGLCSTCFAETLELD